MKKASLLIIFAIFANISFAQYTVTITSNYKVDTVKTCIDTTITFYAEVREDGNIIEGSEFEWDFDDEIVFSPELDADTVEHYFDDEGAYRVRVIATKDNKKSYDILVIKIGLDPNFDGTKSDVPESQNGICSGEEVILTGKAEPIEWDKDEKLNIKILEFTERIEEKNNTSSIINRRDFEVGKTITDANNIDSIGIMVEHSNTSDLQIIVKCTNYNGDDKELILKDFGGVDKYLGEPVDVDANYDEGVGEWYYWDNTPEYGTINSSTMFVTTLPSGTYQSDESFDNLIGCSYNGDWQIIINDNTVEDNGHLFEWSLYFNNPEKADTIIYENIYKTDDVDESWWEGEDGLSTSMGEAEINIEGEGNHSLKYLINDDFGCEHDTSINVMVEKANFEADKISVYIGEEINFTDNTSWAANWKWDFGNETDTTGVGEVTKKYMEEDEFTVLMKVESESGCKDSDTLDVTIKYRPVELHDYNIFTPNDDGVNEIFSFFIKEDDKITLANIKEISGVIVNRDGNVVCRWNTPEEAEAGWDGTVNFTGAIAPPGVYFYAIKVKGKKKNYNAKTDKIEPFSGTIYLYR